MKLIPKAKIGWQVVGKTNIKSWDKMDSKLKELWRKQYEYDWKNQDLIYLNNLLNNLFELSNPDIKARPFGSVDIQSKENTTESPYKINYSDTDILNMISEINSLNDYSEKGLGNQYSINNPKIASQFLTQTPLINTSNNQTSNFNTPVTNNQTSLASVKKVPSKNYDHNQRAIELIFELNPDLTPSEKQDIERQIRARVFDDNYKIAIEEGRYKPDVKITKSQNDLADEVLNSNPDYQSARQLNRAFIATNRMNPEQKREYLILKLKSLGYNVERVLRTYPMGGGSMRSFDEYVITDSNGNKTTLNNESAFDKALQYAIENPYEDPNNENELGEFIIDVTTGVGAAKTAYNLLKAGVKTTAKQTAKTVTKQETKNAVKAATKATTKAATKQTAKQTAKQEPKKVIVDRMSRVRKDARKVTKNKKNITRNINRAVQKTADARALKYSSLGERNGYKRLNLQEAMKKYKPLVNQGETPHYAYETPKGIEFFLKGGLFPKSKFLKFINNY